MVNYCVAFGCKNLHHPSKSISFHSFPFRRPEVLKLWIQAMKRDKWYPSKTSRICSEHFLPNDYKVKPWLNLKLLKPDAVPSVFHFPKHLLKEADQNKTKVPVKSGPQLKNISFEESLTTEQIMQEIDYDKHENSIQQQIGLMEETVFIKTEDISENPYVETNTSVFDVDIKNEEMDIKDEDDIGEDHLNQSQIETEVQVNSGPQLKNIYAEKSSEHPVNIKEEIVDPEETLNTVTTEQIIQSIDFDKHEHSIDQQISLMGENVFIKIEDISEDSNVKTNTNLLEVIIKNEELIIKEEENIVNEDHLNQKSANCSVPMMEAGFSEANTNNLPKMELLTIMDYFIENNNNINKGIKRLKSDLTGRPNYGDNSIGYVQVKHSPLLCEIRASLTSEYDTNVSHCVSCIVNKAENIVKETKCHNCVVNKGGCIHAVAFLMWLHRRNEDPPSAEEVNYWKPSPVKDNLTEKAATTNNSGKRKAAVDGTVSLRDRKISKIKKKF